MTASSSRSPLSAGWVLVLCTVFGFLAGGIAYIFFALQLNIPVLRDFYPASGAVGADVVIQTPRRVIIQHDEAINQTLSAIQPVVVGIYPAAATVPYTISQLVAQGFVYTTDGWIVTAADFKQATATDFVIVTTKKEVFPVQEWRRQDGSPITMFKISGVNNLTTADLLGQEENVELGQQLLVPFGTTRLDLAVVTDLRALPDPAVTLFSSDSFGTALRTTVPPATPVGTPLFNLDRQIIGLVMPGQLSEARLVLPTLHWRKIVERLTGQSAVTATWGLHYYDLSLVTVPEAEFGAQIAPNGVAPTSPAANILQSGDIVTVVDDQHLSTHRNLAEALASVQSGDKVEVTLMRDGRQERVYITAP